MPARGTVVVEDAATALREAGDVTPPADRPLVVKTVGMSWEDLVVAEAVVAVARR